MNTVSLLQAVTEASDYLQVCVAMDIKPDPLCQVMVALRDALNLLPAIPSEEVARRNAGVLSVSWQKLPDIDAAYDETDATAHLVEFPR